MTTIHTPTAAPPFLLLASADGEVGQTMFVVGLVAIPLLIAINGFFVAAEFALVAVRGTRVEELVNQKRAGAEALHR